MANAESGAWEKPHVCALCEAGCGLVVRRRERGALHVAGNPEDVFSRGYLCPKGAELGRLEADPARLTRPVKRTPGGDFEEISWEEGFDRAEQGLRRVQRQHGRDAVAVSMGTVLVHKYSVLLVRNALHKALKTRNFSGVSSQDTTARFVASHFLYGSTFSIAVPDIDRTRYLLCLGANPFVSNGSMMTAPNVRRRLRGILERGGKVVVIDPRRTETARAASEHHAIVPGTDALFVLALISHLVDRGLVDESKLQRAAVGWGEVKPMLAPFTPQRVSASVGLDAHVIERLAEEFSRAESSVAYGRMGTSTSRHSTLACYAVELLNLVAGRLGVVGGAMFPTPAVDPLPVARAIGADTFDTYRSRVRGLPETVGEIPSATLAEEMETPGAGQVRALVTYASNPVLGVPNGRRLQRAIEKLDFVLSVDIYVNETTRYADVILPPAGLLAEDHLDLFFANMAVRNVVRWSPAPVPRGPKERLDWEILLELAERLGGGLTAIPALDGALRALRVKLTPAHMAAGLLRLGPHGDRFLPFHPGLNRKRLEQAPHGVDLGALRPGFRRRVLHRGGKIRLACQPILSGLERLAGEIGRPRPDLLLIGRRHLRSNNSWMHNLPRLAGGKPRCVLLVHPEDAARVGVKSGQLARLESAVHAGEVSVQVSDEVRPGVVSLPHGYGHGELARFQAVAASAPGASANDWTDDAVVDEIGGQSVLNAIAVTLRACPATGPRPDGG